MKSTSKLEVVSEEFPQDGTEFGRSGLSYAVVFDLLLEQLYVCFDIESIVNESPYGGLPCIKHGRNREDFRRRSCSEQRYLEFGTILDFLATDERRHDVEGGELGCMPPNQS